MSWKRFLLAVVIVGITQAVVSGVIYAGVLDRVVSTPAWFRPEGEQYFGPYLISRILFVATFVYLFRRFSPVSGVYRGIQFGFLIWLLYSIPTTIGLWAFAEMPDQLATGWIVVGLFELLAGGAVLGKVLKPRSVPAS